MRRAAGVAVVIALALVATTTVGADVNYPRIKTKVVFKGIEVSGSEATFFGKLKSKRHACVKRRRGVSVTLVGTLGLVGQDRTDRKGRWEFTRSTGGLSDGEYEATIGTAFFNSGTDKKFRCRPGSGSFVTDDF